MRPAQKTLCDAAFPYNRCDQGRPTGNVQESECVQHCTSRRRFAAHAGCDPMAKMEMKQAMQQLQEIIQLMTKMMKKFHEMAMSIIRNM